MGILVYEMLIGEPPFTDSFDPIALYQKIIKAQIPDPVESKRVLKKARGHLNQALQSFTPRSY